LELGGFSLKFIIFLILSLIVHAQDLNYKKPNKFDFLYNTGDNFKTLYNKSTDKENLLIWGGITTSTLLLIKYDRELVDASKRLGKKLGITSNGKMKSIFDIGGFPIYVPTDNGSALYFLGDGITHVSIMAGFFTHGMMKENDKSLNVSTQLAEGLIGVTIVTQLLKHITGRETPTRSSTKTGKWRWFPNPKTYHIDVPKYDAFPSGHFAVSMMTLTVLAENYPENPYIKPIGYTLMSLLGFQMMNNGVHWASDYPLGIAIGYAFGKIASKRERDKAQAKWSVKPIQTKDTFGIAMQYRF